MKFLWPIKLNSYYVMKNLINTLLSCLLMHAGHCYAQEVSDTIFLQQLVVSASGHETLLSNSPEVIRVIDSRQIAMMKPSSLGELLNLTTGIQIETGTGGGLPFRNVVNMNGFPASKILVLIDGERLLTDHVHTGQNIEIIPVEHIERIEIIRGASSSQYGSDAMGGIVNIITKKCAVSSGGSYTLSGGSLNTLETGLSVQTPVNENIKISTYAGWTQSEGPEVLAPVTRIGLMHYRKMSVFSSLGFQMSEKTDADLNFAFVQTRMNWTDGFKYGQFSKISAGLSHRISDKLYAKLRLPWLRWESQRNNELNEVIRPAFTFFFIPGDRLMLNFGCDFSYNRFARNRVEEHTLNSFGVFLQGQALLKKKTWLMLSLRTDKPDGLSYVFSPKLSLLQKLNNDKLFLRASVARGFHAPTVQEMYELAFSHGGSALRYGNPDLKPEYSTTFSLISEYYGVNNIMFMLGGYYSAIDDMIVPVYQGPLSTDPAKDIWMRENIAQAKIYGFEITAKTHAERFISLETGYSWSDNLDVAAERQLPYKPGWNTYLKILIHKRFKNGHVFNMFSSLKHTAARSAWNWRPAPEAPPTSTEGLVTPLNDYQMLDAGITFSFRNKHDITLKASNILQQEIEYLEDAYTVYAGRMLLNMKIKIGF
jgi:outer membrane receptor for ferrienterochelin and colicins